MQKQNLEMICDPSDYFIHVSEAGEDRKQLSMADTWGEKIPAIFFAKPVSFLHILVQWIRCVP